MPEECDRTECNHLRDMLRLPAHPVEFCSICVRLAIHRRSRDAFWIGEAHKAFEGVRDPIADQSLVKGWAGDAVPAFVLHEIWKRDPRVQPLLDALLAEQRAQEAEAAHDRDCPYAECGGCPPTCQWVGDLRDHANALSGAALQEP